MENANVLVETSRYRIHGFVEPGYEAVYERFRLNFENGIEECAQLCAYVKGIRVIDIWGSVSAGQPGLYKKYDGLTIQNVFSTSKVITSFVLAMLADRGYLKYDQLVSSIWPEYGKHGKEETTIAHVLRHEAGLPQFKALSPNDLSTQSIKSGKISSYIESLSPVHKPGAKRIYHAFSRGIILNEIVRRADPKGRTIGEFIKDEIAEPLNLHKQLCMGIAFEEQSEIADLTSLGATWSILQYLLPRFAGGGSFFIESFSDRFITVLVFAVNKISSIFYPPHEPLKAWREQSAIKLYNDSAVRSCEFPSGNLHASAHALATVAALVAENGKLPHMARIVSSEGIQLALDKPRSMPMHLIGWLTIPTCFTNAGWNLFGQQRYDYCGWMGYGGSVAQWHQEERIGFGYAMNCVDSVSFDNSRAKILQRDLLECARKLRNKQA